MRAFISQLRPPILDEVGLDGAIRDAAATLHALSGAAVEVDLAASPDDLGDAEQVVVLRVLQEALQNVRKHAGARHVVLGTRRAGGHWILEVRDDGRGFDPDAPPPPGGAPSDSSSCASGPSSFAPSSRSARDPRTAPSWCSTFPFSREETAHDLSRA